MRLRDPVSSQGKKWRLFRAWAGRHPVWCAWQVTYRCNFRCGFCPYWQDPMGRLPEAPLEDYVRGSRKLATVGSMLVSLAGGEPMLRRDLPEIVRAVAEFHFPFITTNGYLVTESKADELMAAGLWGASVSIDYADPTRHDEARKVSGAFDRAVAALRHFAKARRHPWQRVNLMTVLLHDNIDHLDALAELAGDCGAYIMIQPYSHLKTGSREFSPTRGVSDRLLAWKDRNSNVLSNRHFLSLYDVALNGGVPKCLAGTAFFNIDSTGDVAICVENRPQPVGNLHDDSMSRLGQSMRRAGRANDCQCCWYNCRGEVEMLYSLRGLVRSLPTLFFDRGRAPRAADNGRASRTDRTHEQGL